MEFCDEIYLSLWSKSHLPPYLLIRVDLPFYGHWWRRPCCPSSEAPLPACKKSDSPPQSQSGSSRPHCRNSATQNQDLTGSSTPVSESDKLESG